MEAVLSVQNVRRDLANRRVLIRSALPIAPGSPASLPLFLYCVDMVQDRILASKPPMALRNGELLWDSRGPVHLVAGSFSSASGMMSATEGVHELGSLRGLIVKPAYWSNEAWEIKNVDGTDPDNRAQRSVSRPLTAGGQVKPDTARTGHAPAVQTCGHFSGSAT